MQVARFVLSFLLIPSFSAHLSSQQPVTPPQRDTQAVAALQNAVAAMGGTVPSDSSASGTITIVEGSSTQTGTIQILTRGTDQTAEQTTLPDGKRSVVYSRGDAKEISGTQFITPSMELTVTDQSSVFPFPLLLSVLNNPDQAYQYVGQENLNGTTVEHIQIWNTFTSHIELRHLAQFSAKDIWLDSTSSLPLKIAYSRREGEGAVPSISVEVFFSKYTKVNDVLYPFHIERSYNGTPWQTINIQSVTLGSGLKDADFAIQ